MPPGAGYLVALAAASILTNAASLGTAILTLQVKVHELDPVDPAVMLSTVGAIAATFSLLGFPLFGRLSDRTTSRFGRRRPYLVLGAALFVLGALVCAAAGDPSSLTVGWVVMTLGLNSAQAATMATIADQLPPQRRGVASAIFGVSGSVGGVVGIFLAQLLAPSTGPMFLLSSVLAAAALLVFAVVLRDTPIARFPGSRTGMRDLLASYWVSPVRHPAFAFAFVSRFLFFVAVVALGGYQALFLIARLDVAPDDVGSWILVASLLGAGSSLLAAPIAGRMSDRFGGRKAFIVPAAMATAVGLVLVASAETMGQFLLASAVAGLGQGVYFATQFALVTQVLPEAGSAGKDLGVMALADSLPAVLVPAIAPLLLAIATTEEGMENFTALFLAGAFAALVGGLVILPIKGVR